jgi:hypothetical protein
VIGSGDRGFIVAFEQLVAVGILVAIVTRRRALAHSLAVRANGCVRYLRADPHAEEASGAINCVGYARRRGACDSGCRGPAEGLMVGAEVTGMRDRALSHAAGIA